MIDNFISFSINNCKLFLFLSLDLKIYLELMSRKITQLKLYIDWYNNGSEDRLHREFIKILYLWLKKKINSVNLNAVKSRY